MVQALLSDYSINTLLYSLWQNGVLSKTFDEDEVSPGVEINFFNNLPVGQVISNVYLPEKISTCPKKKGTVPTISFEVNFGKTFVK